MSNVYGFVMTALTVVFCNAIGLPLIVAFLIGILSAWFWFWAWDNSYRLGCKLGEWIKGRQ